MTVFLTLFLAVFLLLNVFIAYPLDYYFPHHGRDIVLGIDAVLVVLVVWRLYEVF
jgi:hypothetical protein